MKKTVLTSILSIALSSTSLVYCNPVIAFTLTTNRHNLVIEQQNLNHVIVTTTSSAITLDTTTSSAINVRRMPTKTMTEVELNKMFVVTFNKDIDGTSISPSSVYINDENGNSVDFTMTSSSNKLYLNSDKQTIFKSDTNYTLRVVGIKSIEGKQLKEIATLKFRTITDQTKPNEDSLLTLQLANPIRVTIGNFAGLYSGEYDNNLINGQGIFQRILNDKVIWAYKGQFTGNQLTGTGKLEYDNGNIYEGTLVNAVLQGSGTLKYSNGTIYTGDFANNSLYGQGKVTYKDGSHYEGGFVNGLYSGKGKLTTSTGDVIEGQWLGGIFTDSTGHLEL